MLEFEIFFKKKVLFVRDEDLVLAKNLIWRSVPQTKGNF